MKKKVVHYNLEVEGYIKVDSPAFVQVLDHPDVADGNYARTSTVLNHDVESGVFETLNTIYQGVHKK